MRVSASGLCRIELDGMFLLGFNLARLKVGRRVLTPLGGGIEFDEAARGPLSDMGATFENNRDLRLTLPSDNLALFDAWFKKRIERELTPQRELREELVDEFKILPNLTPPLCTYRHLVVSDRTTSRAGYVGLHTHYYHEIFDTTFDRSASDALCNAGRTTPSLLRLVTQEDIEKGSTLDGIELGDNCRTLLV